MPISTVVRVDPKTLLVGPNVRREVTLRPEFVASITEHGVIVPILAQESADGLEVVDGQMRTLAAVDAALAEVPVFVRPPVADEASRIVEQIVVNEDRASLTTPDHVAAIAQLALDFKVPAAEIARRTGASKDDVAHIVTASKSKPAIATIGQGVTLELAAKMAEAELTEDEIRQVVGYSWNKEQALRQVLDTRARNAETARLTEKLQGEGIAVVAKPSKDDYQACEKNKHRFLGDLVDAKSGKKVTTANHKSCPGHAAFVGVRGYNGAVEVHYLCTDPANNGHRDASKAAPVKLTDAERARKEIEKQRAAQWEAVCAVRIEWIREQLLTRKTAPAGFDKLALADLTETHQRAWGQWAGLALELVGQSKAEDDYYPQRTLAAWGAERPINTWRALVASVIARHESVIDGKNDWNKVSVPYLRLLATWGYELGEIEQAIVDEATVA